MYMTDYQPPIVNVPIFNPNYFLIPTEGGTSTDDFVKFPVETRAQTFQEIELTNVILGNGAVGTGNDSIAIGKGATCGSGSNSAAIGANSSSTESGMVALGNANNFFSFNGFSQNHILATFSINYQIQTNSNVRTMIWTNMTSNPFLSITNQKTFTNITNKRLTIFVSFNLSISSPVDDNCITAIIPSAGMWSNKLSQTSTIGRQVCCSGIISLSSGGDFEIEYQYMNRSSQSTNIGNFVASECSLQILVF
jgi:hypothetical protein